MRAESLGESVMADLMTALKRSVDELTRTRRESDADTLPEQPRRRRVAKAA